jgi:hypothetical protein
VADYRLMLVTAAAAAAVTAALCLRPAGEPSPLPSSPGERAEARTAGKDRL